MAIRRSAFPRGLCGGGGSSLVQTSQAGLLPVATSLLKASALGPSSQEPQVLHATAPSLLFGPHGGPLWFTEGRHTSKSHSAVASPPPPYPNAFLSVILDYLWFPKSTSPSASTSWPSLPPFLSSCQLPTCSSSLNQ